MSQPKRSESVHRREPRAHGRVETDPDFAAVRSAFEAAAEHAGERRAWFAIGGHRLLLRLAGEALEAGMTRAFGHLRCASGPADLEVAIWDSVSTGITLPPRVGAGDEEASCERVLQPGSGLFSLLDGERGRAVLWIQDAETLPDNEVAAPLRALLHLWFRRHGGQLVHAGAVGLRRAGVLIAGRSGAGKSTTALACLRHGLDYAGDDYVLLQDAASSPRIHSLYNSAKLTPQQLETFPELATAIFNPDHDEESKPTLFVHELAPERVRRELPLAAILLPNVAPDRRIGVRRATPRDVVTALAPSTIFQLPDSGAQTLRKITHFASRVPSYWLDVGPDLEAVATTVRSVLHDANDRP